jgi:transposase
MTQKRIEKAEEYDVGDDDHEIGEIIKKKISVKTLRKWFNQFDKHGKLLARADRKQISILQDHELEEQCLLFCQLQKTRTVDICKRGFESIQTEYALEVKVNLNLYDILLKMLPLHRSTVYNWMIRVGCKCEKATYYTNDHEIEETRKDRIRYVNEQISLSLRKPIWVRLQKTSVEFNHSAKCDIVLCISRSWRKFLKCSVQKTSKTSMITAY